MADTPADHPARLDDAGGGNPRPPTTALSVVVRTLAALGGVALLYVILLPSMGRPREAAQRIKCRSNLRQIGMACIMYAGANGNRGRYPDSVATLFAESDLPAEAFNCASSDATRAVGPTTRAAAAALQNSPPPGSPGHCLSYVYVGGGLTDQSPPTAVVAYDLPTNHPNKDGVKKGGNVLYADCTVVWYDLPQLTAVAAAVQAGQNPPPAAATQPIRR